MRYVLSRHSTSCGPWLCCRRRSRECLLAEHREHCKKGSRSRSAHQAVLRYPIRQSRPERHQPAPHGCIVTVEDLRRLLFVPKIERCLLVWVQTDEASCRILDVPALRLLAKKRLSHSFEISPRIDEKLGRSERVVVHFWCASFLVH